MECNYFFTQIPFRVKICTPFLFPKWVKSPPLVIALGDHKGRPVHTAIDPPGLSRRCISGSSLSKGRTGAGTTPNSRIIS